MKVNTKMLCIISSVLMILGFGLNINDFITGATPEVTSSCISILFVASCCCLSFVPKNKKISLTFVLYTGFIAIFSLATFIVGTYRLSADYLIPFVLIAMPPFYGLSLFSGFDSWSFVVFILSTLLFTVNVYISLKKKTANK